ncbi:MAG: hypothetical protein JWL65_1390 [Gammaproteobacteria bacterium]|nr:hypothetical protein [Gammaproteobacteria bacterium]
MAGTGSGWVSTGLVPGDMQGRLRQAGPEANDGDHTTAACIYSTGSRRHGRQ